MTVQKHYVIVANHDDATAYTYTNHGSALVEVKKWHNEFSGASDQDIYTDKPGRQSAPASQVPGVDSMNRKDAAASIVDGAARNLGGGKAVAMILS